MTRPTPRPLASVTALHTRTPAEQTMAVIPLDQLTALYAVNTAAARLVRLIVERWARQEHRVPRTEYKALAARLEALAEILREEEA